MTKPSFKDGRYQTQAAKIGWFARHFPSLTFNYHFFWVVVRGGADAKRGRYDNPRWSESSQDVLRNLENVGVRVVVEGAEHFLTLDQPCLFIGNHMSTLETVVLPGLIQPYRDITFVAKSSLAKYPIFQHVIKSRDPILVDRTNPREDFGIILSEGQERLRRGLSLIIFPQSTRSTSFDPAAFNKIGVKLASRSHVPIIPIALQTDAWSAGVFGRIDPSRTVRFAFGPPIEVQGRGHDAHQQTCEFIADKLQTWNARDGRDRPTQPDS